MPRRRRRMARPPRKARPADWVYRPNILDTEGAVLDGLGSYEPDFTSVVSLGHTDSQARILYDSFNFRSAQVSTFGTPNVSSSILGASAKAEGRNPLIRRVEGYCTYRPQTWAIGNTLDIGLRFGIFEQDPTTGNLLLDPDYRMLDGSTVTQLGPSNWANNRMWQKESRVSESFASNDARFIRYFRFNVNRLLRPHECYAIYIEAHSFGLNSSSPVMTFVFRTLVSDEG